MILMKILVFRFFVVFGPCRLYTPCMQQALQTSLHTPLFSFPCMCKRQECVNYGSFGVAQIVVPQRSLAMAIGGGWWGLCPHTPELST